MRISEQISYGIPEAIVGGLSEAIAEGTSARKLPEELQKGIAVDFSREFSKELLKQLPEIIFKKLNFLRYF